MRCDHCGGTNFNWARTCDHCHAALRPEAAPQVSDGGASTSESEAAAASTPSLAPAPFAAAPVDEESAARAAFAQTLLQATPHAYVTWALVALNIAVFLAMLVAGPPPSGGDTAALMRWGALYGPAVSRGEWWRILTAMFVHGGFFHLFANMYVLIGIGTLTERLYGNVGYAILYLLSGIAGGLVGLYWHPVVSSVGASGAVFGMMGAVLAYVARHRHTLAPSVLRGFAGNVIFAVVLNLVLGFAEPNIDMAAHVGGLVGGFLFGLPLAQPLTPARTFLSVRLHATVAAAGLLLAALVTRQLPVVDDWHAAVDNLRAVERVANDRLQEAMRSGGSDDAVAKAVNETVLPPWMAKRQELAKLRLPAREHGLAAQLVRYMDLRAEGWRLLAQSIQTGDLELMKQSREKQRAAASVLEAVTPTRRPDRRANSPNSQDVALDQAIALKQWTDRMTKIDQEAVALYNRNLERLRAGTLTGPALATIIEEQVIPDVKERSQTLSRLTVPPDLAPAKTRLTKYLALRSESWQLLARGLRTNSVELIREANRKQKEADVAARAK